MSTSRHCLYFSHLYSIKPRYCRNRKTNAI